MISIYLNQEAMWSKTVGKNAFAEPTYTTPCKIKVRWEGKRRMVRDVHGREVVSEFTVTCLEKVNPGDLLTYVGKEFRVIGVSVIPDLDGKESHREVSV